jgi:hypothetical protein
MGWGLWSRILGVGYEVKGLGSRVWSLSYRLDGWNLGFDMVGLLGTCIIYSDSRLGSSI